MQLIVATCVLLLLGCIAELTTAKTAKKIGKHKSAVQIMKEKQNMLSKAVLDSMPAVNATKLFNESIMNPNITEIVNLSSFLLFFLVLSSYNWQLFNLHIVSIFRWMHLSLPKRRLECEYSSIQSFESNQF